MLFVGASAVGAAVGQRGVAGVAVNVALAELSEGHPSKKDCTYQTTVPGPTSLLRFVFVVTPMSSKAWPATEIQTR